MYIAFVGLGSNLQYPMAQVLEGFNQLSYIPRTYLLKKSSLYISAAAGVGYKGQPNFVNAVAKLKTDLCAEDFLTHLMSIEAQLGRIRSYPNQSRTLDLDLLLYENLECHQPHLTLPHPRMHERNFVLIPLAEILNNE